MFRNTWNQGVSRVSGQGKQRRARRWQRTLDNGIRRLLWGLEQLEDRRVMASLTWQGDVPAVPLPQWNGGVDTINTNWSGNALPADGDTLIFPVGPLLTASTNDTAAGNSYTLQITGGTYLLSGNSILLDNAGPDVVVTGGTATGHLISTPLTVNGLTEIQVDDGNLLTLQGAITEASGGSGELTKSGDGMLILDATTSVQNVTVTAGTLVVDDSLVSPLPGGFVSVAPGALLGTVSTTPVTISSNILGAALSAIGAADDGVLTMGVAGSSVGFSTAGYLGIGPGATVTLLDSDEAELGLLTGLAGPGDARLTAVNGLAMNVGETLTGSGTIDGALSLGGGLISPDVITVGGDGSIVASDVPAVLDFASSLTFGLGGTFDAQITGANRAPAATDFDVIDAVGDVDLTGGLLNLRGSYVVTRNDPSLILLSSAGLTGLTGEFTGLSEGDTVPFNGVDLKISYMNNRVELFHPEPIVTGTANDESFLVSVNGGNIQIFQDGTLIREVPLGILDSLTIDGGDGDDVLLVDFTNGNPIPDGGLYFNGQAQATPDGDSIVLNGGTWTTNTYNYTNANDGNVDLDGSMIYYTGLEPLANTGTVADIIFNLPNTVNPDVVLSDSAAAGQTQLSGSTFELTIFNNPTASLTINGGNLEDTITLQSVDAGFTADIRVDGGAPTSGTGDLLIDELTSSPLVLIPTINNYVGNFAILGSGNEVTFFNFEGFNSTTQVFDIEIDLSASNDGVLTNAPFSLPAGLGVGNDGSGDTTVISLVSGGTQGRFDVNAGQSVYTLNNSIIQSFALFGSDDEDTVNVQGTAAGLAYSVITAGGNDTVNVSSDAPANLGDLNQIDGWLLINTESDDDAVVISDRGDTVGDTYRFTSFLNALGGIETDISFNDSAAAPGPAITLNSGDFGALPDRIERLTLTAGSGNDRFTNLPVDLGSPLSAGMFATVENIFEGNAGNDDFAFAWQDGFELPAGTDFIIRGGLPGSDSENRDRVTFDTSLDSTDRVVTFTYTSPTSGNMAVTGLRAGGNDVVIETTETVVYEGGGVPVFGDGDVATVFGTGSDDDLTVGLLPNNSSAIVFRGGNPYLDSPPESLATFLPGVAGGSAGPDLVLRGLSNAAGLGMSGGGNSGTLGTGDRLIVQATSESPLSTGGTTDMFGFGAGVLLPGLGAFNAYDTFDVNRAVSNAVFVTNNSVGPLMPVFLDEVSFQQNGPARSDQRPAVIINGGNEAVPQADGVADLFEVFPFPSFNVQVNGNLPGFNTGPDGLPIGDTMRLVSPTSINMFSDKVTPPNVMMRFGDDTFGILESGLERVELTPLNGQLILLGDNGNAPGADQTDNFVVLGRDVTGDGDGSQEGTIDINGSAPRFLFDSVSQLNVISFEDVDTLEITPYADDTPRGWEIDVYFDEGLPTQADGDQADLLIIHTSAFVGTVSEDIVIRPAGPDNGEVIITNGSFGTPIVDINFVGNTDIIVHDDDNAVNDTDTLTLLGKEPDNSQASGDDEFQIDFTAAGTVADPIVTVSDIASGSILYRVRDIIGFRRLQVETLGGDDLVSVRGYQNGANINMLLLEVDTGTGDDRLELNNSDGLSLMPDGIYYDGGAGNDELALVGNRTVSASSYQVGPDVTSGTIVHITVAGTQTVHFTGLEPILDTVTADTLTVYGTDADNAINYQPPDGTIPGFISVDGFEPISFLNKTRVSVAGLGGSDHVIVYGVPNQDDGPIWTPNGGSAGTLGMTGAPPLDVLLIEKITFDADGDDETLTIVGTAGDDTFVHQPGSLPGSGLMSVTTPDVALLPLHYQGFDPDSTVVFNGNGAGAEGDLLTVLGTAGNDNLALGWSGSNAIRATLETGAGFYPTVASTAIANFNIDTGDGLDLVFLDAQVDITGQLLISSGSPARDEILTVFNSSSTTPRNFSLTPADFLSAAYVVGGVGTADADVWGFNYIEFRGGPSAQDTLTVNLGPGDNSASITRGQIGDRITTDAYPDKIIEFTGLSAFTVDGQAGSDVITFAPWFLGGSTNTNYNVIGGATDTMAIAGSNGGGAGDESWTVSRSGLGGVQVTDGKGTNVQITASANLGHLKLLPGDGDDVVTLNLANGLLAPRITYDGGGGSDLLRLTGTPATPISNATYRPGPDVLSGQLTYGTTTIDFTNLEPIQTNIVTTNLTILGTPANNAINYTAGPGGGVFGASVTGLVSIDGFETLEFNNHTNLIIDALAGDDVINLNHASNPLGLASITVNGNDPTASDVVIINNATGSTPIDYTPDSAGTGDVDQALITGAQLVPVTVDTVELVMINGTGLNDTLDVNTPATPADSLVELTPGATIDSGHVQVNWLLPMEFKNLGPTARLTVTDPNTNDADRFHYNGTAYSDAFSVPFGTSDTSIGLNFQIEVDTVNIERYVLRAQAGDDVYAIVPPSSRNVAITALGDAGENDLVGIGVNSVPAAPRTISLLYDSPAGSLDPDQQVVQQSGLGLVRLVGVEKLNLFGTQNADIETLVVVGTNVDDTITYTPLGTGRGTLSHDTERVIVNFEDFDQGEDNFVIQGGGGFADRVIVQGTQGRDLIQVRSNTRTITPIVLPFAFPSGPGTANPGTVWRDVVLDATNASPGSGLVDTVTIAGRDGDDTFHVVPGVTANNATLFVNIDGGQPEASDALVITNLNGNNTAASLAATDFVVVGRSRNPDAGNILVYQSAVRRPNIAYTNVEVVSVNVNPVAVPGLNPNLLILGPDPYEQDEFMGTPAYLGSGATINAQRLSIFPNGTEHSGVPADTDYFQVVAEKTGTLDFQVFFRTFNTALLPGGGQLGIQVLDRAGNVIGGAGTFGNPDGTANARVRVPAVQGQTYFLHVFGANADGTLNSDVVNGYDMTIVNAVPPVPFALELTDLPSGPGTNPPGGTANSDTGRSRFDNITFDNTPTIIFRLDDAIFLQDLPGNSTADTPPDEVIPIPFQAGPTQPTVAGYAIAIFDEGALSPPSPGNAGNNQVQQPLGFATQIEPGVYSFTTPVLNNGSHFLTARVQMIDPATPQQTGWGARSLALEIIVDTVAPPVAFGTIASTTDGLHPDSDSEDVQPLTPLTRTDRITNDVTPKFWGVAEADAYIRVYVDQNSNGLVDAGDVQIAQTTVIPLDGGDQYPSGYWEAESYIDLNDPAFFSFDGQRNILVTAEDVAGNVSAAAALAIFIDTQGPQVTGNPFISDNVGTPVNPAFNLFALKPANATQGPTPLVDNLSIPVRDLPARTAAFIYQAVSTGPPAAVNTSVSLPLEAVVLTGDANGVIPIASIVFRPTNNGPGIATGNIIISFVTPLPDDRYTLRLNSENILDPAGNALNGENDSAEPGAATFPTGDGRPGGDYLARFTVDSRPEIGVWASGTVWVDINGNSIYDQDNIDHVNRDFVYSFGNGSPTAATGGIAFTSDNFIAGDFNGNGFDKLAAYGSIGLGTGGPWRWLVDTNDDGRPDLQVTDPQNVNGLPVAGNFDAAQDARDEVGLFTGTFGNTWWFDTNGDFQVDTSVVTPQLRGYPIVGDFDGDGFDDLGAYENGRFTFLVTNGTARSWLTGGATFATLLFDSVSGVRERPVAADMDQDGIDDIGLWMPDRAGQTPVEGSEWFFLISADRARTARINGTVVTLAHAFSPVPLGNDLYAQFGDAYAIPIVGNFDPPVGEPGSETEPSPIRDAMDVNFDGFVTSLDVLGVINELNKNGFGPATPPLPGQRYYYDVDGDGYVAPSDARVLINYLNRLSTGSGSGEGEGSSFGAAAKAAELAISSMARASVAVVTVEPSHAAMNPSLAATEETNLSHFVAPALGSAASSLQAAGVRTQPARELAALEVSVLDAIDLDLAVFGSSQGARSNDSQELTSGFELVELEDRLLEDLAADILAEQTAGNT